MVGAALETGPEISTGTSIDNDVALEIPGYLGLVVDDGGRSGAGGLTVEGQTQVWTVPFIQDLLNFVQIDSRESVFELSETQVTMPATLVSADRVVSEGEFQGQNGYVQWRVETWIENGVPTLFNRVTFTSDTPLGDLRMVNYLNQPKRLQVAHPDPPNEILYVRGTPGQSRFREFMLDANELTGGAGHGGVYQAGSDLIHAVYEGWAADDAGDLQDELWYGGPAFTVLGNIDVQDLPEQQDSDLGPVYGPGDLATAFAWRVDPSSYDATITSLVELFPDDSASDTLPLQVASVNDPPEIEDQTFTVQENSPPATLVGILAASHPGDPDEFLTFSVVAGNEGGVFAIDAATGAITVVDGTALDYETTPSYHLTVEVRDSGTPSLADTAAVTIQVTDIAEPQVHLEKTANGFDADTPPGPWIAVGEEVRWTYLVTNTGNVPLDDVVVIDDHGTPGLPADDFEPLPVLTDGFNVGDVNRNGVLDPGETWRYRASEITVAGQHISRANVIASDRLEREGSDENSSCYFGVESEIRVQKMTNGLDADTPPGPLVAVGEKVQWTYLVTNTGNVPLEDVVVIDDHGTPGLPADDFEPLPLLSDGLNVGDVNRNGVLDPGETWLYMSSETAVMGQNISLATVSASDGLEIVSDKDPGCHFGMSALPDDPDPLPDDESDDPPSDPDHPVQPTAFHALIRSPKLFESIIPAGHSAFPGAETSGGVRHSQPSGPFPVAFLEGMPDETDQLLLVLANSTAPIIHPFDPGDTQPLPKKPVKAVAIVPTALEEPNPPPNHPVDTMLQVSQKYWWILALPVASLAACGAVWYWRRPRREAVASLRKRGANGFRKIWGPFVSRRSGSSRSRR